MKPWILSLLLLLIFAACSRDTAYKYFAKLDSRHERAVTNLRRVTLEEHNETQALVSVLYLNPVDPQLYHDQHYFFIGLFDRQGRGLEAYGITLNGKPPVGMARLDNNCSLRSLMPLNNPWNRYYEVVFRPTADENLTLNFEIDPSLQGQAVYDLAP